MSSAEVECASAVEQRKWDELAAYLGGSFFHTYAYGMHESVQRNTEPLFIKAFDQKGECCGVAVTIGDADTLEKAFSTLTQTKLSKHKSTPLNTWLNLHTREKMARRMIDILDQLV